MKPLNNYEKEVLRANKTMYFAFLTIKHLRGVELITSNEHIKWEAELIKISDYKITKYDFFLHILESYGIVGIIQGTYNEVRRRNKKLATKR